LKLIVGLGNPGRKFTGTPHNAGFETVERFAQRLQCKLRRNIWFNAKVGKTMYKDEEILLVEPLTYMNRSGSAVTAVKNHYGIDISDILVILDDADLEMGQIRIKPKGGSGGHRGLQSIIDELGTEEFARLRIGIGRSEMNLKEYVLTPLPDDLQKKFQAVIERAVDAVECILQHGCEIAMSNYNRRGST
jgi:PTH1 family peptidyl-tRNA hydrolase